jgi:hypothetical protein
MSLIDFRNDGFRRPIWEGMGTKFDTAIPASLALREIGADFKVIKAPTYAAVRNAEGKPTAVPLGKYELMRVPDHTSGVYTPFGRCGKEFEIIQRSELAAKLDAITGRWPLEVIGEIDGGQTVFFLLNAGRIEIHKDPVEMYYLLVDTLDGGTSLKSIFTTLRLRCTNALMTALKTSAVNISMNHRSGVGRNFEFNLNIIGKMVTSQVATISAFEMMAKYKITAEQVTRILDYVYPQPKTPAKAGLVDLIPEGNSDLADIRQQGVAAAAAYDYYVQRSETMQVNVRELFGAFNDETPHLANTSWALYNAFVENADWRKGVGEVDKDALLGHRANEKRMAFAALQQA